MTTTEGGVFSGQALLSTTLSLFMVQAIIVILMTRTLAAFLHYVGQPRVIAEVIGGIILGPSVLGRIPGYLDLVFPKSSLSNLGLVANIGLVLYLFLVGIEMDPATMVANTRKTCIIAICGIGLPFGMGFAIAPYLFKSLMSGDPAYDAVKPLSFSVFVCVAISITAFPVLARILNETGVLNTVVGNNALGAAALDDVAAWSLLALSIALIHASQPIVAAYIFLSVVAYALGVLVLVRPLWWRVIDLVERGGSNAMEMTLMATTFVLVFFSAWVTEILGVHAIFGAFLFGLAMPRDHRFTLAVSERIEDIVQIVFLPLYFTLSGLKTDVGALKTSKDAEVLVVVVVTAVAAKFVGCTVGARLSGLDKRESVTIGILMNTRGLVELIVLNVGLEAGVLSESLFTCMVMMAIITTVMTTPLVQLVYPNKYRKYLDTHSNKSGVPKAPRKPQDVDLMMVVTHVDEVPALSSCMHLLHPVNDKGSLRVSAAYLVESSIHTTDILRTYHRDNIENLEDPSLQLLQLVGSMAGAEVESSVLVGNPRQFADDLSRMAKESFLDLCIVPFREGTMFMGESYEKFLAEMINKASQMVVILVNPAGSHHNILDSATQTRRNILVLVTGEEDDHEVLCVARRFASAPQVQVSLVILKESNEGVMFDSRVQSALDAFSSSLTEPERVATTTLDINTSTAQRLVNLAKSSHYDFVLIGHTALELPVERTSYYHEGSGSAKKSTPYKRSGSSDGGGITPKKPIQLKKGMGSSSETLSGGATPRKPHLHHHHSKGGKSNTVLGTMGCLLIREGVQSSILVVHGANSFMESSTSLSMKMYDKSSADTRPTIKSVDWEAEAGDHHHHHHVMVDVAPPT